MPLSDPLEPLSLTSLLPALRRQPMSLVKTAKINTCARLPHFIRRKQGALAHRSMCGSQLLQAALQMHMTLGSHRVDQSMVLFEPPQAAPAVCHNGQVLNFQLESSILHVHVVPLVCNAKFEPDHHMPFHSWLPWHLRLDRFTCCLSNCLACASLYKC
jgi:hypothetical protein